MIATWWQGSTLPKRSSTLGVGTQLCVLDVINKVSDKRISLHCYNNPQMTMLLNLFLRHFDIS
jgi:hypothetical protein